MLQFVVHNSQNQKVCYNMVCMFYKTEKYAQWVDGLMEGFLRGAKSGDFL
ncbi:hypothetical protein [Flavobacterium sp.]|jgi:hypothetical protein